MNFKVKDSDLSFTVFTTRADTIYGGGSEDGGSWTTTLNLNVGYDMGGASGRQSGSTFKLFTLMEWLRRGHRLRGT